MPQKRFSIVTSFIHFPTSSVLGSNPAGLLALKPAVLCPRLKNNLLFFYLNYILLAAVVLLITVLATVMNSSTLVMVDVLAVVRIVAIRTTSDDGLQLGPITIARKTASTILTIITGIVLFFMVKDVFYGYW
mmetsp:Transcript_12716/g.13990  ORF Transcript_12716/g.13990 Transcript_12716/m.13990 type:complete len:132 (-) Transcript_12716:2-397(-)